MWPQSVKEKPAYNANSYLRFALDQDELNVEIISLLIDRFPDALRIPNKYDELPLHKALFLNKPLELLTLLVKSYPESVRVKDRNDYLPLHLALKCSISAEHAAHYLNFLKLLVKYWPESIQEKNDWVELPLHLACQKMGHAYIDIIWYLFHLDPQAVRVQDIQLRLPLHIICAWKTIPQKLVQRFVREWPASILMAGQYSVYSELFTEKDHDNFDQ